MLCVYILLKKKLYCRNDTLKRVSCVPARARAFSNVREQNAKIYETMQSRATDSVCFLVPDLCTTRGNCTGYHVLCRQGEEKEGILEQVIEHIFICKLVLISCITLFLKIFTNKTNITIILLKKKQISVRWWNFTTTFSWIVIYAVACAGCSCSKALWCSIASSSTRLNLLCSTRSACGVVDLHSLGGM